LQVATLHESTQGTASRLGNNDKVNIKVQPIV